MDLIKLNTIKNKVNQFPLRSSIYFRHFKANDYFLFAGDRYKRNYTSYKHQTPIVLNNYNNGKYYNALESLSLLCNTSYSCCTYSIEQFLLDNKDVSYKGFVDIKDETLVDETNYKKLLEDYQGHNFYTKDNPFVIDTDNIYLFIRIIPKEGIDLTGLYFNCSSPYVYNICGRDKVNNDKLNTLGFITKLDNRYILKNLNERYEHIVEYIALRYPFLTRDLINKKLFEDTKFNYSMQKTMLYITDTAVLDEYNLKVVDI